MVKTWNFQKTFQNRNMLKVKNVGCPSIYCFWAIKIFVSSGQKCPPHSLIGLFILSLLLLLLLLLLLFSLLLLFVIIINLLSVDQKYRMQHQSIYVKSCKIVKVNLVKISCKINTN